MDKATKLLKLAKEKFGETLTKAEIKLLDNVVRPGLADYGNDEDHELRAEVIEWLCSDKKAIAPITHYGICLKEANINNSLNLAYLDIPFRLNFEKCNIREKIELHSARLKELYLGGCHIVSIDAYGVKTDGHIFLRDNFEAKGKVDFTGAKIEGDFDCSNGHFFNPNGSAINLSRARIKGDVLLCSDFKSDGKVVLIDSHIEGNLLCNGGEFINSSEQKIVINASRLRCGGDVSLKSGFKADGEVTFTGGSVGGNFECFDCEFSNHNGDALNAEALNVDGGIFLMGNFKGEVRLLGATAGQSLECHGGNFDNPNGYAINADSANIGRNVFLRNSFKANGEINLIGAKIGGDIDCEKGHFINPDGIAIHGDGIEVGGSIFLRHGFIAEGIVSLSGGKIKNNFDCEYGQFTNKVAPAILAEGLSVGGSVLLCSRHLKRQGEDNIAERFKAEGGVSFERAVIDGHFDCQGSLFINPSGYAFLCSGIKVNGNVHLCRSSNRVFRAEGRVSFNNAIIGGSFNCKGGEFVSKIKDEDEGDIMALSIDCAKVDDSVILSNNFRAEGRVSLLGAEIGKQLDCVAGQFLNPNGIAFAAECARIGNTFFLCGRNFRGDKGKYISPDNKLNIEGKVSLIGIEVKKSFVWCKVNSPDKVSLDLQHATIGSLWDERDSWPKKDKLFLHGLIYDEIADKAPRDVKARKEWLSRQPKFVPQPYVQLAKVLKDGGNESDAKKIMIAKENARLNELEWYRWLPHAFYWLSVGYGYRPWRALVLSLLFIILGCFLFHTGFKQNSIVPLNDSNNYPRFQPLVYSLDVFLPVVDLYQDDYWIPDSSKNFWFGISEKNNISVGGKTLNCYMWVEIIAGWVLTTLFVVSLTGLIRR